MTAVALNVLHQVRPCGECSMCCKLMEIDRDDGTKKPHGQWCENARLASRDGCATNHCAAYETRWKPCRDFVCAWAGGLLPLEATPRKTRCIVRTHVVDGKQTVVINEDAPRAADHPEIKAVIGFALKRGYPCVVIAPDGRRRLVRKATP